MCCSHKAPATAVLSSTWANTHPACALQLHRHTHFCQLPVGPCRPLSQLAPLLLVPTNPHAEHAVALRTDNSNVVTSPSTAAIDCHNSAEPTAWCALTCDVIHYNCDRRVPDVAGYKAAEALLPCCVPAAYNSEGKGRETQPP